MFLVLKISLKIIFLFFSVFSKNKSCHTDCGVLVLISCFDKKRFLKK